MSILNNMSASPIVFIHGMYMTSLCWEHWMARFQSFGRNCIAPNWPGRDFPIDDLRRRHPNRALGRLTLTQVVEHFSRLITALPKKPTAIGHSMGGLIVQILLQRELVLAGVAIDSAPPARCFGWQLVASEIKLGAHNSIQGYRPANRNDFQTLSIHFRAWFTSGRATGSIQPLCGSRITGSS